MIELHLRLTDDLEALWKRSVSRFMESPKADCSKLSNEAVLEWHLWRIEDLQTLLLAAQADGLMQQRAS